MSFSQLGLVGLGLYLLALVVVAGVARRARQDASPADHFLANRGLGLFVVFLTLYATAYSGNSLLGYPGEAYRRGFSWVMATGFMMSIIVGFHLLVPRLRPIAVQNRFVTPGDWVRHRFGDEPFGEGVRVGVGLLMTVALANFLLAQLMALGHVTSEVTGGAIPYAVGVVGMASMILFYETVGGMRAVAWTDAAQGVLMLAGLGTLLAWILGEAGGLAAVTDAIARARPDAVAVPGRVERTNWASTVVLMGVASILYPQAIQRIYAARTGRTLGRAFALMGFMPLTTTLVVTLIGLAAIPRFEALGTIEADTVMPRLLGEWAATGPAAAALAVVVFIGALAAIMSTADSVLLSLGSILALDVVGRSREDEGTTRLGKRIAMVVMGLAVLVALNPRFTLWRLIELKMELLIQCAPAFLLALHWRGLRAGPVLLGLVAGTLVAAGAALFGWKRVEGIHVGVIGLVINAVVVGLASWVQSRSEVPASGRVGRV
ncbi:MAG: sodium:solute symporter family protein [Myxococcota bacterium]|nr:sodium:solute symporter family protein [Myxococcota bacterium]